jgi:hypothetical protein
VHGRGAAAAGDGGPAGEALLQDGDGVADGSRVQGHAGGGCPPRRRRARAGTVTRSPSLSRAPSATPSRCCSSCTTCAPSAQPGARTRCRPSTYRTLTGSAPSRRSRSSNDIPPRSVLSNAGRCSVFLPVISSFFIKTSRFFAYGMWHSLITRSK